MHSQLTFTESKVVFRLLPREAFHILYLWVSSLSLISVF